MPVPEGAVAAQGAGSGDPSPGGEPGGRVDAARRMVGRHPWWTGLVVLVVAAVLAMTFVRLPYFAFSPGSVNELSTRITVTGSPEFTPVGEVHFTTVRQDSTVNVWEFIQGTLDDSILVLGEDAVLGDRGRDENREFNLELMQVSKSTAVAVALQHLGFDPFVATGVGMVTVEGPAEGLLTTDDVIRAIDGVTVDTTEELVAIIRAYPPGSVVEFEVEDAVRSTVHDTATPDAARRRLVTVTLSAREDDPTAGFLGIRPQTRWEDTPGMPFDVVVETGGVGGNSAGLALTLAVLDLVTPGELTGGLDVATTGTISLSGAVGPIGGIEQKTIAARRAGIDVFIVPNVELAAAQRRAGDMRVAGVDTLDDALAVLAEVGGNALELEFSATD